MYIDNPVIKAYADMVYVRKERYVSSILDLINKEGDIDDESLHQLYDTLKAYVLLDMTYTKLLDLDTHNV